MNKVICKTGSSNFSNKYYCPILEKDCPNNKMIKEFNKKLINLTWDKDKEKEKALQEQAKKIKEEFEKYIRIGIACRQEDNLSDWGKGYRECCKTILRFLEEEIEEVGK